MIGRIFFRLAPVAMLGIVTGCGAEAQPQGLSVEQRRLFGKCTEAYDNRASAPWAADDITAWCSRALQTDLPDTSREKAIASAMERVGTVLMGVPFDEEGERLAEAEVERVRTDK